MTDPAVFLDRDGVLTLSWVEDGVPRSPLRAEEMEIDPLAPGACAALAAAGFRLVCVTNQPEVARGRLDPAELEAMNERLRRELPLAAIMVCPHDDPDDCDCRKPSPGMILEAADRLALDLGRSFTVGDRWRDIEAGGRAGTRTVFIDRGYNETLTTRPDHVVGDIEEASEWILRQSERP